MSEAAETTASVELRPGLLRGFLGIWTFEWQSRLTWGKLWMAACFVGAIPALMLATLPEGETEAFLGWILNFHLLLLVPALKQN